MRKYKLAVFIGRMQPLHNGHVQNINKALEIADKVLIILGSANEPRTIKNPFTVDEREAFIKTNLYDEAAGAAMSTLAWRISVDSVEDDLYRETKWVEDVQACVRSHWENDSEITILGHEKDQSSYYLKSFPQWDFTNIGSYAEAGGTAIDATKIRELYFEGHFSYIKSALPHPVYDSLMAFKETEEYEQLVKEFNYIRAYKTAWAHTPYPVTFFTTDAVVIQSGHILLINRRAEPGKGLWALPGGFLGQDEAAFDSAIRELKEETKLKVPEAVLRGSCKARRLFDHPNRSLRGRTITQAFLFDLPDQPTLPKVKGSDDAAKAQWFPLDRIKNMSHLLFEDHKSIISMLTTRAD